MLLKKSDFYLTPSDIKGKWQTFNDYCQKEFGYSAEEAELALRIYHPRFGDGYRNDAGQLMVKKSADSSEFRPISAGWITKKMPAELKVLLVILAEQEPVLFLLGIRRKEHS